MQILDRKSASPLHYAARFDAFECVRLLVEHRASINRQDAHGNTPLHCLARSRSENQRTAHLLVHQVRSSSLDIENEDHQSVLSVACEHGQTRLVEMLLAHRANVGCSMPMHMAIKGGHLDIVHQLLDYPSSLPSTKFSLHLACQYNRIDILRMLLKRSHLDLEVRDEQGYTPLLTAGAFNHLDCLTLLLNHSADITARDEQSRNVCKYIDRDVAM